MASTQARWIRDPLGVWHAFSPHWFPGKPGDPGSVPVCGAVLPRTRQGRMAPPAVGQVVCQECAELVGFARRPGMTAYLLRRHGHGRVQGGGVEARLALLEGWVDALRAKVGL